MDLVNRLGLGKPKPTWDNPQESVGDFICAIKDKYTCWEAIGRARRAWEKVGPDIKKLLDYYSSVPGDTSRYGLMLEIYMIGKDKETAAPTVFICCTDKRTRKEIRKLINAKGFLNNYPGMGLGDTDRFPDRLGEGDIQRAAQGIDPGSRGQLIYTVQSDGRILGQKLLVYVEGSKIPRKATGGPIVWINGYAFQFTVSHILDDGDDSTASDDQDHGPSSDEWSFDGDEDTDDDAGDGWDEDMPSDGSRTPEDLLSRDSDDDAHGSGDSRLLSREASTPSISSFDLTRQTPASQRTTLDTISDEPEPEPPDTFQTDRQRLQLLPTGSSPGSQDSAPSTEPTSTPTSQKALGNIFYSSGAGGSGFGLDYSLISVDWQSAGNIVQVREYLEKCSKLSLAPPLRHIDVEISAWTSSTKPMHGRLSAAVAYLRTPWSMMLQEVIPVRLDGVLSKGDCGAAVIDMSTGHFHGHIVAGTPGTGIGYIVSARHVFKDIEERLGYEVKLSPPAGAENLDLPKSEPWAGLKQPFHNPLLAEPAVPLRAGTRSPRGRDHHLGPPLAHTGGSGRPSTIIQLASSTKESEERLEILSNDAGYDSFELRRVETRVLGHGQLTETHTRLFSRSNQRDNAIVLLYTFAKKPHDTFDIKIGKDFQTVYSFRGRRDLFTFQSLVTGYRVLNQIEGIQCHILEQGSRWSPRRTTTLGHGEIQVWKKIGSGFSASEHDIATADRDRGSTPSLSTDSGTSYESVLSSSSMVFGKSAIEKGIAVVQDPCPPMVVLFLERDDGSRSIYRVDGRVSTPACMQNNLANVTSQFQLEVRWLVIISIRPSTSATVNLEQTRCHNPRCQTLRDDSTGHSGNPACQRPRRCQG